LPPTIFAVSVAVKPPRICRQARLNEERPAILEQIAE